MALAFVQAGAGAVATTGTGTVSLTGCKAGNLLLLHHAARGVSDDYSISNAVNIERLDGTPNATDTVVSSTGQSPGILYDIVIGRVTANGTVSQDFTVGASGEDLYARIYEFSGGSTSGVGVNGVFENGSHPLGRDVAGGSSVTPNFSGSPVISNGADRLGFAMGALASNQAVADMTGETGGYDFTQPTAAFGSATGATCTLFIQTAPMVAAGTCDNGSFTVGVSTDWGITTFALIPAPSTATASDDPPIGFLGRGAGW